MLNEELQTIAQTKSFLQQEFLTWLWYEISRNPLKTIETLTFPDRSSVNIEIWVDNKLVFHSLGSEKFEQSIKGDSPASTAEASTALRLGRMLKSLRLGIVFRDIAEVFFELDDKLCTPKSIKLPDAGGMDHSYDFEFDVERRIMLTSAVTDVIDEYFREFMERRLESSWTASELPRVSEWMKQGGKHAKTQLDS